MGSLILSVSSREELWRLHQDMFGSSMVNFQSTLVGQEEFEHIFGLLDAIWVYRGEPDADFPHALLAAGDHSNGFFDCARVLRYSNLCQLLARHMVQEFRKQYDWNSWDAMRKWIVGTATSSTDISKDAANFLGAQHVPLDKRDKLQVWPERQIVGPEEEVICFEELMTTSTGVRALRQGIQERHQHPIRFGPVVVLVHRTDITEIDGSPVLPIFHYDIQNWKPDDCPYCMAGSEAIKPKEGNNWGRLHRRAA